MKNYVFGVYMKRVLLFLLLVPFLMSTTCENEGEDCHVKINFINKSDKELYVDWSALYPDTINSIGFLQRKNNIIKPKSSNNLALRSNECFEKDFISRIKSGIIMIYVFDNKITSTTSPDTIFKYKMYLERYDITLEELQNMNWEITYP